MGNHILSLITFTVVNAEIVFSLKNIGSNTKLKHMSEYYIHIHNFIKTDCTLLYMKTILRNKKSKKQLA